MSNRIVRTVLSAACLLLPTIAAAADLIPVENFTKHVPMSEPRLSPDGQYLAINMGDGSDGSHALVIYKVDDMTHVKSMLRLPRYELAANIVWVSNTRLVIEYGKQMGSIDEPKLTGEILATDLDGKHQDYLYGYQNFGSRSNTRGADEGWGFYDGNPTPVNGHFYMATQNWNDDSKSTLYDVDSVRNTRHLIAQLGVGGMTFVVGADGKARYAYGRNESYDFVVYHQATKGWEQMSFTGKGGSFTPFDFTPDDQGIYATYSADGGPASLIQQDENGANRKVLASPGFSSVGAIEWTAMPSQPFATRPMTGFPTVTYIDPNLPAAKLHRALSAKFADSYVHFINFSEDGGQLLFSTRSDRNPGSYYLIDTHTYKVRKLFDADPAIDPDQMAERHSLRFKSSDGTELEAILTIPKHAELANLPMVLMPHGGPMDISDSWFYDYDSQFLASRGYLVLQVNFRGSSGRGVNFIESGYHQWGTGIQSDLIDAVKWAIAQKYADPKRICVYGGSFGGYSAMMTVIRAPGMFKCAVGYAGVYDMAMLYKKGDTHESKTGRSAMRLEMGDNPADLDANSPDKLADKIDVPVLLIHGEEDQRVPIQQAEAMRAALDAAHKPYEWLVKPGEGHGFYDEKNNIELYTRLQQFLEKNIGKGV